jgi:hypothetical protein
VQKAAASHGTPKKDQSGESLWIGWHKSQRYIEDKKASLRANERVNRRFTAETKTAPENVPGPWEYFMLAESLRPEGLSYRN